MSKRRPPTPPATKLRIKILRGPTRNELYHQSEYCLDGKSGRLFITYFQLAENPYVPSTIYTHIPVISKNGGRPNSHRLHGLIRIQLPGHTEPHLYKIDAYYNTAHYAGTIEIKVPHDQVTDELKSLIDTQKHRQSS